MCEELFYQIINASAVNQAAFFKNNGGIKFNGKQYCKYIFVENNKIEILFSNYIFGLTFQSLSSK